MKTLRQVQKPSERNWPRVHRRRRATGAWTRISALWSRCLRSERGEKQWWHPSTWQRPFTFIWQIQFDVSIAVSDWCWFYYWFSSGPGLCPLHPMGLDSTNLYKSGGFLTQFRTPTLTLKVRSGARGDVLKYSKMESWKSWSFRPAETQRFVRVRQLGPLIC